MRLDFLSHIIYPHMKSLSRARCHFRIYSLKLVASPRFKDSGTSRLLPSAGLWASSISHARP